ncbi:xanthine dehydrogenase family protein subunit M [Steroidobacter sp. S1-65]|uniref:Xanthine dehydrogenase family protein subunit M n=1 Tax=Steroidobacter gossypii TaxID=2805490 RepID=A0ABS1WTG9_9GAMM|nr:xanthine dehydrogenase family protein subunit M [Steroidobacter gossypii]MBM0104272.1 xanthine dehydrogenase family protein subunit M [Steroidobacter gossypii]
MQNFSYVSAARPEEAVKALGRGCAFIAGGTELLNWMRLGIATPDTLIDIGGMEGHSRIERTGDHLIIGALATLNEVGEHPLVRAHATVLADACLKAASPQIRNRATLGGNVLQKTRCAYFRSETPLPWGCNKRSPGSGCAARDGLNELHAVLGWADHCVATHPSDPAVALACLDASAEVMGKRRRMLPMTDFHVSQVEAQAMFKAAGTGSLLPAHEAQIETRLARDELILAYHIPIHDGERSAYLKVRERESYEYALVSAAATVALDGGLITRARIALGSVAQKPWRLVETEAALIGRRLVREEISAALRTLFEQARPLAHNEYKVQLAANAALRAVLAAGGVS